MDDFDKIMQELVDLTNSMHGYCSPEHHCLECDGHLWDCEFCGAYQSISCCDSRRAQVKQRRKESNESK